VAAGAKIKDPAFILEAFQDLMTLEAEFPIKVEGTKTLPYAAVMTSLDPSTRRFILKLVRPLPPALAVGASFEIVLAALGKRFEGRISYLGREGYLQYQFECPLSLEATDRRLWKRYPIRPREDLHVTAQDAEIPGHGITGPLLNLSMGGLVFRVDRMLRLEDGMPVHPGTYLFEPGKTIPLLRLRGFPKGDVLEARGQVVRALEANSELHVCIQMTGMSEAGKLLLARFLDARERQGTQSSRSGREAASATGRFELVKNSPTKGDAGDSDLSLEDSSAPLPGPEQAGLDALLRLDRRCTNLLLVSPPGTDRDRIALRLEGAGYRRFAFALDLFEAHACWKAAGDAPLRMLLVDLEPSRTDGLEPMGAVRHLEPLLRSFGELPVAFVTRLPDPMLELMGHPSFGALAQEEGQGRSWGIVLDGLLHRDGPIKAS